MQAGVRRVAHQVLPPEPGWSVLDVGCGTGAGLADYAAAGCEVTGVDVSPAMLKQARLRLGDSATLQLTDGGNLSFQAEMFDLVTSSMVLHEVPAGERVSLLTDMARVAKPDGHLFLIDFRFGSWRGWRGPVLRVTNGLIERFAGHYPGYRSFKDSGGIPVIVEQAGLAVEREKIVAGGNLAVYIVSKA